jgi:hypothetical protein
VVVEGCCLLLLRLVVGCWLLVVVVVVCVVAERVWLGVACRCLALGGLSFY